LKGYFRRLFKVLGIVMTPNIVHYLGAKDNNRNTRLEKIKSKETKKNKMKRKFKKLQEWETIARHERSKRDGTYKSGQNMKGDDEEEQQKPAAKKSRKDAVC
jgi:hypothetical protein